jgi:hypothetical protein
MGTAGVAAAGAILPVDGASASNVTPLRDASGAWLPSLFPPGHHPRLNPHPDAALIVACEEYLRIKREFSAYYDSLHGIDMEAGDPAFAILDPIPALVEQIVAARATTPDGHLARARCMAFTYLPHHRACQDDPEAAAEDRFHAAMLRDLARAERGTPA